MVAAATFPSITHDDVFARLTQQQSGGITVITPNHRLALQLQREFSDRQAAQGLALWESADILPWSGFFERACHDAQYADVAALPIPITTAQAQVLWENLLRNSAAGESLLVVADAARLGHEAWQLTTIWRLESRLRDALPNDDGKAFQDWAPRYDRILQRNGQMDIAQLPDRLLPLLIEGRLRAPQTLIAYGFDALTPQQTDVFTRLQGVGCAVLLAGPPKRVGRVLRAPCTDAKQEIHHAAAWARARLEAGHARIGVVVPDIAAQRADIVRIFSATMAPDYALPGAVSGIQPFNLSLGEPLVAYPLVRAALLVLELTGRDIEFERASRLLRTPFIAGGESEYARRAELDVELRDRAEPALTLERLLSMVAQHGGDCPQLARLLSALAEYRKSRMFGAHAPSVWARTVSEALAIAGFPGERSLDSYEYQTLKKWHDVVAAFAQLDRVVPRMGYAEAVARLRRMAADTLFQPEVPDVPIQILGVLEAAGMTFDCLWVMGLSDGAWPPAPRPNPFLPLALQRVAGIPQCAATEALAWARRLTTQWQTAADEIVLSYPQQEDDRELQPSPLIAQVPVADPETSSYPDFRSALYAARAGECLTDDVAPALLETTISGGGTALIKDQAACPFRAFARHRLRATAPVAPHAGLDAAERGTLVHRVLAQVWTQLRSHEALLSISSDDLDALLGSAAAAAVDRIRRDRPATLSGRFADIEKRRLISLARAWLEQDRRRGAFTVIAVEDKRGMAIGGLTLNARLDRVDETADGRRIVIDYKTGKASAGTMLGERPDEPQLPLYVLTAESGAAAAAFAQVRAGNMKYAGLARDGDLLPEIKAWAESQYRDRYPAWPDVVAAWRADLSRIAAGFAAGDAAVDPLRYPQTCRYCDLQPVCRIHERLASSLIEEDDAS